MDRNEFLSHIWEAYESGGQLTACAWCRFVCIDGEWIVPPAGALSTIDEPMTLSHSVCPDCATVMAGPDGYEELMRRAKEAARGQEPEPAERT